MDAPTGRRLELLEAAVHVAADDGLRGLTHRAVDRRAGLPEGTASAYLRTKQQLLLALAEHVTRLSLGDVDHLAQDLAGCEDDDRAAELVQSLFERWLDDREVLLARLQLTLEAPRNNDVADVLASARGRLVSVVDEMLTAAGKEHSAGRAEALVASFDGLLLTALMRPPDQRQAFLSESLGLVLHALTDPHTAVDDA